MKVLFLDIDGVLNSYRTMEAFNGYPHCYDEKNMARFDHVAIGLIRKLCDETGCSIVLSSSWRMDICKDTKQVAFKHANALNLPIIDCTPQLPGIRGLEINAWLSANPNVTTYAIVDDDSDMLPSQQNNFVNTVHAEGLSFKNYADLRRILGKSLDWSEAV